MFRLLLILIFVLLWLYSLARSATQPLSSFIFNFHFCTLKALRTIWTFLLGWKWSFPPYFQLDCAEPQNLMQPPFSPLRNFPFCFYFWLLMTLSNGIPLRKSPCALMGWVDPRNLTPGFLLYQSKPHPAWYCFFFFSTLHDIVFSFSPTNMILGMGREKSKKLGLGCDKFSKWGI